MESVLESNPLPNINEVTPFSESDEDCLKEVTEVLKKHNCLKRFGVNLLHQHFPIGDGEVMLETNNPEERTLQMRTVKIKDVRDLDARITSWRLDVGKPTMACICVKGPGGHSHQSRG